MRRSLALLLSVPACGSPDQTPAWALQHATVDVSDDGSSLDGYQIWEFYTAAWAKSQDGADHVCSRVQSLVGTSESHLPDGCPGCVASYAIALVELETDCDGDEGTADTYAGTTRYAIGAVANGLADDDPHPGTSQGWFGGWGGTSVEALGFAWNAALDQGESPTADGWVGGETYTLEPGFAWDLSGG